MPNVFDYLEWRGDLSFAQSPVNEVDSLIFCLLSYVDLDGIVPADPKKGRITVRAAAAEIAFVRSVGLSEEDTEAVLHGNAERLLASCIS